MRNLFFGVSCVVLAFGLSACGGGGGVNSTPTPPAPSPPTPTPAPPPTNTLITDLKVSQNLPNDGGTTSVAFNVTSKTTILARAAVDALTVRYDAGLNSYTVTSPAFSETFTPADRQADRSTGEANYRHALGGTTSYLTLATTPYSGSISNKYVGLGYLQRNSLSGDRQSTEFTTFAYGLDTLAAGVPRSGTGMFAIDVFGLESFPGTEPNVFQGRGRFDVDFASGLFSTKTGLTITGLVTGNGAVGGGLELTGGGRLSATDGRFSGDVVYGSPNNRLGGALTGRFFGPNGEEVGASFAGAGLDGSAFNGSFTGQRDTAISPVNISFLTLVTPQLFFGDATTLNVRIPMTGAPQISDYPGPLGTAVSRVQLNDRTSGNVSFGAPTSDLPSGDYTTTSVVSGNTNFTTYQREIAGQPTKLELYKTGSANRELALTYASFGRYATSGTTDPFVASSSSRVFFTYGFATPNGIFTNRTGSASYSGVAYGAAVTPAGTLYDVTGTSQVAVNFTNMNVSGAMALRTAGGTAVIDYGSFSFAGRLYTYPSQAVADIAGTGGYGSLLLNFYGPAGEEVAGPFRLRVPDGVNAGTLINGVLAAKKQ